METDATLNTIQDKTRAEELVLEITGLGFGAMKAMRSLASVEFHFYPLYWRCLSPVV
jgi:hypothetical protein